MWSRPVPEVQVSPPRERLICSRMAVWREKAAARVVVWLKRW